MKDYETAALDTIDKRFDLNANFIFMETSVYTGKYTNFSWQSWTCTEEKCLPAYCVQFI